MKQVLGLLLLVALGARADGVWDDIPAGKLGFPLGTYLTIEGEAAKPGPKVNPTCTLVVDTVNGKKLDKPTGVVIEGLKGSLPQTGRIVVRGYESGEMIGIPGEVLRKEKLSGPQAGWQFYRYFVITSWVQPAGPAPSASDLDERLRRLREERARVLKEREAR